MPSHHPPRAAFSAFAFDDTAQTVTYTFTADRKDKPVPASLAEYIYRYTITDPVEYAEIRDAGADGTFFNENVRPFHAGARL